MAAAAEVVEHPPRIDGAAGFAPGGEVSARPPPDDSVAIAVELASPEQAPEELVSLPGHGRLWVAPPGRHPPGTSPRVVARRGVPRLMVPETAKARNPPMRARAGLERCWLSVRRHVDVGHHDRVDELIDQDGWTAWSAHLACSLPRHPLFLSRL